jgi:hypothetical protein
MVGHLSRRAFLTAAGGGLLALLSASIFWRSGGFSTPPAGTGLFESTAGYVDHDGWMVTPADKQKLTAQPIETPGVP